jgi:hypothetical protein
VRSSAIVTFLVIFGSFTWAQDKVQVHSSGPLPKNGFGSSAVWVPTPEFVSSAKAACANITETGPHAECLIQQVEKGGAPKDALKFTRELYANSGEVGTLGEIKSFGPVSYAWIVYPFREGDPNGLMFLNGDPNFINPDDLSKIDKSAMLQDTVFQQRKKATPKLDMTAPVRTSGSQQILYARAFNGDKPGFQRFLFSYPLTEGCQGCPGRGVANYFFDFDDKGKFLGAHFISITRGMPPKKAARPVAPNPPEATAPSNPPVSPAPDAKPQ